MLRRLRQFQEDRLTASVRETGLGSALACFYATTGRTARLRSLRRSLSHDDHEGRLACTLLGANPDASDANALLRMASSGVGYWAHHAVVKQLLSRGLLAESLAAAYQALAQNRTNASILNTIIRYLSGRALFDAALLLSRAALAINPLQDDVRHIEQEAQKGRSAVSDVCLSAIPRYEAVTCYIPVYNVEQYLGGALESLVTQSYPIAEILVIDDGTKDESMKIAADYPARIVRHECNKGLAAARNTAFRSATTRVVAGIDADVRCAPDYLLGAMAELAQADETVVGVGGCLVDLHVRTPGDKFRSLYMCLNWGPDRRYNPNHLVGGDAVYFREAYLAAGGIPEKYRTSWEDCALAARLKRHGGSLVYAPQMQAWHARSDDNKSVLDTKWSYHYWPNEESGVYDRVPALIVRLRNNLTASLEQVQADSTDGRHDLLFLDFMLMFYISALDIAHIRARGHLSADAAAYVLRRLDHSIRRLDARHGGDLATRCQALTRTVVAVPAVGFPHYPLPHRDEIDIFLAQVDSAVGAIDRTLYARILAAADHSTAGSCGDVHVTSGRA